MTETQKTAALKKLKKWLETETQKVVAKKLGFSQPYISQLINGVAEVTENFHAALKNAKK